MDLSGVCKGDWDLQSTSVVDLLEPRVEEHRVGTCSLLVVFLKAALEEVLEDLSTIFVRNICSCHWECRTLLHLDGCFSVGLACFKT